MNDDRSERPASWEDAIHDKVPPGDRKVLQELAEKTAEIARSELMEERRQSWRALKDLKPRRPMFLLELFSLQSHLSDYAFCCRNPLLQNVEARLVCQIRQYENIKDDIVIEPYFRVPWWAKGLSIMDSRYGGMEIEEVKAAKPSMATLYRFPIKTPDDIQRLRPSTFSIDKRPCLAFKEKLEDVFGHILPVRLGNIDHFYDALGNQPFTGNHPLALTFAVYRLIGAENMMLWAYDHPQALHSLSRFIVDETKNLYGFLEQEGLLDANTDNQFAGPCSYGYVSDLPADKSKRHFRPKDLWCFANAQEAEVFSPGMFAEFFLPYIAEVADSFGLTYYGCCENVTDRFEPIAKALSNLRTVSISGWSDIWKARQFLHKRYLCSRKPVPAYVSTETADWDNVEKEAQQTAKAFKDGCIEVVFRDAYAKRLTLQRAAEWVGIYKKAMQVP